jgi:hypothetical protein
MDLSTCSTCLQPWPAEFFRLRKKGGTARQSRCNFCHVRDERQRRRIRRAQRDERHLTAFMRFVDEEDSPRKIARLCETIAAHFGGWHRFADAWAERMLEARLTPWGAAKSLRSFETIAKLSQAAVKPDWRLEEPYEYLDDITEEDREREMDKLVVLSMHRHLDKAADALRKAGYEVIPPIRAHLPNDLFLHPPPCVLHARRGYQPLPTVRPASKILTE